MQSAPSSIVRASAPSVCRFAAHPARCASALRYDGALCLLGLRFGLLGAARGERFVHPYRRLVEERAGPEHHLDRFAAASAARMARSHRPPGQSASAGTLLGDRQPSSPTSLSMSELSTSLLQISLDEHLDRLFAEVLVEALSVLVGSAGAAYKRVCGGRRAQARSARRCHTATPSRNGAARASASRERQAREAARVRASADQQLECKKPARRTLTRDLSAGSATVLALLAHEAPISADSAPPRATPFPKGPGIRQIGTAVRTRYRSSNSSYSAARVGQPIRARGRNVLGDAARAHDVVSDHDVGTAILGVHLLDQLA